MTHSSLSKAALAVLLAAGVPGCLPAEEGGPAVIDTGDGGPTGGTPGTGSDGTVSGTDGDLPTGGTQNGGSPGEPGGSGTGGTGTGGSATGGTASGGASGSGGGCVPSCDGRACGPDDCGGTCGRGCADGEVCSDGQCTSQGCTGDAVDCSGECSTLLDDVNHCGNCRTACPPNAAANAVPVCIDAECYITCHGHEQQPVSVDFDNDPTNCGRCGNDCPTAVGGTPQCSGGRCQDPCAAEGDRVLCEDRCVPNERIGLNCQDACCPNIQPGVTRGVALSANDQHVYTIQVDGPHHVSVRFRLNDGTCPGFDSPFDSSNTSVYVAVLATDNYGNRSPIGRGRLALGTTDDCIAVDTQVQGGTYDIFVQARENVGAYQIDVTVDAPAAARPANATMDRSGVYPRAIPQNGSAEIPVHLAQPSHVLVAGMANGVNNRDFPEDCLYGEMGISNEQNGQLSDDDNCPVLDGVIAAGDYTFTARRTFDDPDPTFRAVTWVTPVGGGAAQPVPDGGMMDGAGLAAFEMDRYSFSVAANQEITVQFAGAGCEYAVVSLDGGWQINGTDAPCDAQTTQVGPGDHVLWIHGRRWAPLANYSLVTSLGGGGPAPGGVINRSGSYARPGVPQGGSDTMTLHLAAFSNVTLITSDGNGGCPGDTTLAVSQNGSNLGSDDDGAGGGCSRLVLGLDAGDYDVIVQGYSGAAIGAYSLDVTIN